MKKIKLGDLYSLKNHPFELGFTDVKISALAVMTPPILVVSEILNSPKEYDSETGKEKHKQIRCIFYSHKTHRFENIWFDTNILKEIFQEEEENEVEPNGEIKTTKKIKIEYPKSLSLETIKEKFLHTQVILKSCDYELGKLKTTFIKTDHKSSQKINAHLDFLPPVLTVIDVKINDEKANYNPKTGNLRKLSSVFLLKCKWYNPSSASFSEDFIPIEAVQVIQIASSLENISKLITDKEFIKHDLREPIILENGLKLTHTYKQPLELIFNHYKYKLKYFDFFRSKISEMDLSEFITDDDSAQFNDFIIKKIPEYDSSNPKLASVVEFDFDENKYYRITYKDTFDRITVRIIYIKKFISKKIIIADCLLRNGEERHFRVNASSILKIEILEQKYF
ncbi:hypothetical protein GCM10022217_08440 [Chryseobacterium ginsenosidimutans]|uniref:hypothetical protein n=1 Tax=Chryseobacterium ginsenosidimutans TaxID=687846 RepID=UPI0031D9A7D5